MKNNNKVKMFFFLLVLILSMGLIAACGSSEVSNTSNESDSGSNEASENEGKTESKPVTLKLAHQWATPTNGEGDYRSVLAEKFAEEVNKASNGNIKIEVYPANSLIKPGEQFGALNKGSLDMAVWAPFYAAGKVPEFSITLMPGIIQSFDQAWQWKDEEVGQELNSLLEENGVKNLVWAWGSMAIASKGDNKIVNPEDVNGLLFRGAGKDSEKMLESLGAGISSMPSSEIYSALQTNIIDGTLTSFDSFLSYRIFEVVDHFNYTGNNAFMYATNPLVISKHAWDNKLSEEQQKILVQASNDLQDWVKQAAIESNNDVAGIFRDAGVEVHEMTAEESKKWFEASQPIVEEFASISDRARRLVEAAKNYINKIN
jgi:TRAP-type C4-dicarboxylate transport system substrate-binding protein